MWNCNKTLAGYFFRLCPFVHYADNPWLCDFVFLDNEWLTKGVYTIVDDDKVINQQGRFTFSDLEATYHATVYQGEEAKFIELMNEFKICYEVERHQYLCPFHLPANEPEHFDWTEWQRADNLHFAFDYQNFMPRGILSTFIVNMHDCIVEGGSTALLSSATAHMPLCMKI